MQGPHHRLLEVQSALGRLDNFTTIPHVIDTHTNSEHTDYDCDETIDPVSETEHDSQSLHTDSDTTPIIHSIPQLQQHTPTQLKQTDDDKTPLLTDKRPTQIDKTDSTESTDDDKTPLLTDK